MATRLRVGLLFGGRSAEHEVSCRSARHVAAAMDQDRYQVIPVGITLKGGWVVPEAGIESLGGSHLDVPPDAFLAEGAPAVLAPDATGPHLAPVEAGVFDPVVFDAVFPVLHGPFGEDGTVQGLLELAGIPYVGSGVLGSALGMDKEKMKVLFHSRGLPVADYAVVTAGDWATDRERVTDEAAWLGFPSFVKPANLGSSVGVSRCHGIDSLVQAVDLALRYDRKVLVEEAIGGREIECGVLGNDDPQASVCGEVLMPSSEAFYDYEAKYISQVQTVAPAEIPEPVSDLIRKHSIRAFKAIGAAGMARVDFFFEQGGRGVVVNEINTIPGFNTISMFPKLWEASGISYPGLIDRLIQLALERRRGDLEVHHRAG